MNLPYTALLCVVDRLVMSGVSCCKHIVSHKVQHVVWEETKRCKATSSMQDRPAHACIDPLRRAYSRSKHSSFRGTEIWHERKG